MANDQKAASSYSLRRNRMPAEARARLTAQHERFGGIHWGAAFFGWLSANGLAVLVLAMVSATGLAIGYTATAGNLDVNRQRAENGLLGSTEQIGMAGGITALVILAVAYFAGGYVAGRMSRFDGIRQGLAVWVIGLVVVILLAGAGTVFSAKYNVLARLDLPRIPVGEGTATTGAIVALVAILVVSALAAMLGGKAGERYHRRIDRAAFPG
ncbi:MAG TPA: hypothetical protein VLL08_26750 [Kineosporiaceae bacterium]|nr:hypothetical protein [Kineosporiaceae bacterium]